MPGASSTYAENGQWLDAMARDLVSAKGSSVVIAGGTASPVVHALADSMNSILGNIGQTVNYVEPFSPGADTAQIDQLRGLVSDIDAGKVKMLVILGGNPAFNTPSDLRLNFERLNAKVPLRIHLGSHVDETAEICHWHIPEKHYLESWGDGRAYDGTVTMTQPLIEPLYDSYSKYELVQLFFKENYDKKDYDIVKGFWQTQNLSAPAAAATTAATAAATAANTSGSTPANGNGNAAANSAPANSIRSTSSVSNSNQSTGQQTSTSPASGTTAASRGSQANTSGSAITPSAGAASVFEDRWRKIVHDGFIANSAATPKGVAANPGFLSQPRPPKAANGPVEINILPDPNIYDGRYANNGWLQELPKPLNKVTWDNVGLISPRTAHNLGINQSNRAEEYVGGEPGLAFVNTKGSNQFSDTVNLTYEGGTINGVPMWITPGQPDDVITIFMGYGRTRAGNVGNGIGYDVYSVRRSDAMDFGTGNIQKTGDTVTITSTQIHFNMEGRDLLRSWDLETYNADPKMGQQKDLYDESMYPYQQHQATYEKHHRWGMTVDLNNCVGCNACVIACQSENNIPVVGSEQVDRHRNDALAADRCVLWRR